jgi:proline iminopeptidase
VFSDHWESYSVAIPPVERKDMIQAFYKRLTSGDRATMVAAARAWSMWEAATSYLHINEENLHKWGEEEFAIAVARIECHYFVNRGFLDSEDQLLRNVTRLRRIPAVIVQGRYDVVCPMRTAWALHRAWPEAQLHVVADAGHSAFEDGNTHELISATDKFR